MATKSIYYSKANYEIGCVCEKCGHKYSYTQMLNFKKSYYGAGDEVKELHKQYLNKSLDNFNSKIINGNYRDIKTLKCPQCNYIQAWQINRELIISKRYFLRGVLIGFVLILLAIVVSKTDYLNTLNYASFIATFILAIIYYYIGRKRARKIKDNFDDNLTKFLPVIKLIELSS